MAIRYLNKNVMNRFSVEAIIKRAEKAESHKELWREIYEDCYSFALPQRNLYSGHWETKTPGAKKTDKIFDSTAVNSTQRFANRLQSSLFPPYRNWCRLIVGDTAKNEIEDTTELQKALDVYTEKMFMTIRQTNFDLSMSEFLLDLAVGTACMLIQKNDSDDDAMIRFEAVPQYLVCFEEGPHGKVDNVYRKHRIRVDNIEHQWKDAKLSDSLINMINSEPSEEVDLLEAVLYVPDTGKYCYHLIYKKDTGGKNISEEIVYRVMDNTPWIICRYSKVSGEIYGRGVLVQAISDIKTLNKTKELVLKNGALAISGIYLAKDDGVLNPQNVQIKPGAIISVASNGGSQGPSLQPLQRSADFNVSQIIINDLVDSIKKMLMDDTLPKDTMSARSATEIVTRNAELAQNLGSAFGRLLTEALIPIVKRILQVMDEQKVIDLPLKVDGNVIKIVPQSPLAEAQNMDDIKQVIQFMQIAQGLGPVGQIALNQDKALDFMADKLGIPGEILNTPEERKTIAQQMAQMAMQNAGAPQDPEQPQTMESEDVMG